MLDSYANLKVAIGDFLDRDDLTSQIDDFIDLAEARHKREILFRSMMTRAQASTSGRYLALPTRFNQMKTLRLITNPVTRLTQISPDEMMSQREETGVKPTFFTVHEEIEFDTAPSTAYTVEMLYYADLLPLDESNPSNALLVRAPDAYLYGSLVASAPLLVADERVQVRETLYANARDGVLLADRQARWGGSLVARVTGATP